MPAIVVSVEEPPTESVHASVKPVKTIMIDTISDMIQEMAKRMVASYLFQPLRYVSRSFTKLELAYGSREREIRAVAGSLDSLCGCLPSTTT